MYSQNQEEKFITEFFEGQTGTLLSIGENDGETFSNAKKLIEKGWAAVLVEPAETVFPKLRALHAENIKVMCLQVAITDKNGTSNFHESGCHVPGGIDKALVSTISSEEMKRWKGVEFKEYEVKTMDYRNLALLAGSPKFDFISIDAEGMDLTILKQINLKDTKLLCIEWNSNQNIKSEIMDYCKKFRPVTVEDGVREWTDEEGNKQTAPKFKKAYPEKEIIYQSAENLIIKL